MMTRKRIWAMVLTLVLVVSMLPVTASAADTGTCEHTEYEKGM